MNGQWQMFTSDLHEKRSKMKKNHESAVSPDIEHWPINRQREKIPRWYVEWQTSPFTFCTSKNLNESSLDEKLSAQYWLAHLRMRMALDPEVQRVFFVRMEVLFGMLGVLGRTGGVVAVVAGVPGPVRVVVAAPFRVWVTIDADVVGVLFVRVQILMWVRLDREAGVVHVPVVVGGADWLAQTVGFDVFHVAEDAPRGENNLPEKNTRHWSIIIHRNVACFCNWRLASQ